MLEPMLGSLKPVSQTQETTPAILGIRQGIGWLLGPAGLLATFIINPPQGLDQAGWNTIGVAWLMALWWMTEPIPIAATALLPMVCFPLLGLGTIASTTQPYAHPLVFLFLGGFLIALGMQQWNLHRRLALALIGILGVEPRRVIAGFLIAGAMISMWVSNTATAMMMLPIATSVGSLVSSCSQQKSAAFNSALMLAVAYGATTGGMGTLIGTPPNALLAGYLDQVYGIQIGFVQWMCLGLPIVLMTLPLIYLTLTKGLSTLPGGEIQGLRALLETERRDQGPIGWPEWIVGIVFTLTALAWISRPMLAKVFPMISDTTIAMTGAILLFILPASRHSGKESQRILQWEATRELPWGVLLLFGGGLSLAGMIQSQGVSTYLGNLTQHLGSLPTWALVATVCLGILLLTELTSNTGTAATFLPIVGAMAVGLGENPLLLLVPAALAANCSFMMPVGTPPNAIVFASGSISLPQMAKAGLWLNLLLVPLVLIVVWLLGPWVLGIEPGVLPDWATSNQP